MVTVILESGFFGNWIALSGALWYNGKARKRRTVDTAPLEKPMKHWDKLSIPEKHELAAVMLEAVYVSDENGIEVKFSI